MIKIRILFKDHPILGEKFLDWYMNHLDPKNYHGVQVGGEPPQSFRAIIGTDSKIHENVCTILD